MARKFDIDLFLVETEKHHFCVLKIDGREFRIDFTASQFFAGNVGILVTPRLEKKNFEFYENEKAIFGFDSRISAADIFSIYEEIAAENNLK